MQTMRISRPSPAVVVAMLALVAALAGTAVAGSGPGATSAGSAAKALKKAKKALKKTRQNERAIKNIELMPGPRGAAGPAGPPGGGSPTTAFSFRTSADQTVNNLVNAGGLTIDVSCTGTDLNATAETSVNNSTIYTASFDTASSGDPVDNLDNDADFDTGDPRNLLNENEGLQVGHTVYAAGTSGPVVNVHWSSDENTPNVDCLFVGHVTVG